MTSAKASQSALSMVTSWVCLLCRWMTGRLSVEERKGWSVCGTSGWAPNSGKCRPGKVNCSSRLPAIQFHRPVVCTVTFYCFGRLSSIGELRFLVKDERCLMCGFCLIETFDLCNIWHRTSWEDFVFQANWEPMCLPWPWRMPAS